MRGLVAYANGPYQDAFGTKSLTIAVVTTSGVRRLIDLLRWTERELVDLKQQQQSDLFMFTEVTPAAIDCAALFLGRVWYQPFASDAIALVDLE